MQPLKVQTNWITVVGSLAIFVILWQLLVIMGNYPSFILPGPADVIEQLVLRTADGQIPYHAYYTLSEVLAGLFIGSVFSIPLGYLLVKSPLAEQLLSPYLIASQAIPVIAIAPLLTIWIDSVYWSRVLVAVLVVFFPILINVIVGLRSVPTELYELMASLRASKWQVFVKLELPAALPIVLGGLKIGATLSVIGALVGEFVRVQSVGLGYLLLAARNQFKTDLVFAVIITLGVIALLMYGAVSTAERRLLRWQDSTT